jgi:imidazolonepropionase-like amidohydrolase
MAASDFVKDKRPDDCPTANGGVAASLADLDLASEAVQSLLRELVARKVAITSTLTVFETFTPGRPAAPSAVLDAMLPEARDQYLRRRLQIATSSSSMSVLFKKEMEFERAFARAGGLLVAGTDPTGYGGVVAGYSNWRQLELLVEAGFTPLEAIRIGTLDGARYLGRADRVGSIAAGKAADLVVVRGDPSANITDIEQTETVFKDGIGYDSAKLFASVKGQVGLH